MILLANVMYGMGAVLDMALSFVLIVVVVRALISWVNPDPYNPIVRFLVASSEPFIRPVRRYLPNFGGVDLSPLVVLMLLYFFRFAVATSLMDYANEIKRQSLTPVSSTSVFEK